MTTQVDLARTSINRVIFIGSKSIGFECVRAIYEINPDVLRGIITIDDRNDLRSRYNEFRAFATERNLPIYFADNRTQAEKILLDLNPDLCLVVGWYWLIPPSILQAIPDGILGLHNSLLPKYRGGSPLVWSVINGDNEVGSTLFKFNDGMDDGDVYGQVKICISDDDYISDILLALETATIRMLKEQYPSILTRNITPIPQNHHEATYCAQRIPDDGLIDWSKSSREIFNFIRAQSYPYPGAFTLLNGKKLIIWKASIVDTTYYGTAGQVASISNGLVYVICGDQKPIALESVQLENGAVTSADSVITTRNVRLSNVSMHIK